SVGVHLDRRPWIGLRSTRQTCVLGLDPYEVSITARKALPISSPCVITATCRDDKKRPVTPKAQLCEWSGKVRPAVRHDGQTGHVSDQRASSMMTHYALDRPYLAPPTILPARLLGHLQASLQQHVRQPRQ